MTTKVHLRCDRLGRPLGLVLTPGQRHDNQPFCDLLQTTGVTTRGGFKWRPRRVAADRAYSCPRIRAWLRSKGIGTVIPKRSDERPRWRHDPALYAERNAVERLFARFKEYRRLATRYEKLAVCYHAMWTIALIWWWL